MPHIGIFEIMAKNSDFLENRFFLTRRPSFRFFGRCIDFVFFVSSSISPSLEDSMLALSCEQHMGTMSRGTMSRGIMSRGTMYNVARCKRCMFYGSEQQNT